MALFPNLLRGFVSAIINTLLMLSLLQPRYGKKITNLTMVAIVALNMTFATFCYLRGDLTLLMKLDLAVFAILSFLMRPLFKDSFMQWSFSYITLQNIRMCILILSFSLASVMPYPMYAVTLLRLVMGLATIFIIRRYVHPLYRKLVTHWNIFFLVAVSIFLSFAYFLSRGDDIVQTLRDQAISLHLLVLITATVYVSLISFVKTIFSEYELRKDNMRIKSNQELLSLSATAMEDRINLLKEIQAKSSIANHDRRHFNNTLLELLEDQKTEKAIELLLKQGKIKPAQVKNYCENSVVNAAVSYYMGLMQDKDIKTEISLDIPSLKRVDSLELAMVISNLLENAIHASEAIENKEEREISFTCRDVGRLAIEIKNRCDGTSVLDEDGYPVTIESDHGVGTRSVLAFVEKNKGEIMYKIEDGIFRVRMLI